MAITDPKPLPALTASDIERFWSHVDIRSKDECWPWKLHGLTRGYGRFRVKGRMVLSSRMAFFLHYKEDPSPLMVCHKCDFPVCCNPYHLFKGTRRENVRDAIDKNRMWYTFIPYETREKIRFLYANGTTQADLMRQFGIIKQTIHNIVHSRFG